MLRWIDFEDDWFAFRLVLPVAAAVIALASLLVFVWSFDPAISPIWQVALHHLMLALFLFTTFVLAAQPRSFLGEGFRRAMLVSGNRVAGGGLFGKLGHERRLRGGPGRAVLWHRDRVGNVFRVPMGGRCLRPGGLCVRQVFGPGAAADYPREVNPHSHAGVRVRLDVDSPTGRSYGRSHLPPAALPWSWRLAGPAVQGGDAYESGWVHRSGTLLRLSHSDFSTNPHET